VLNVLLNAAIVSAAVHRVHKFSFRRTPIRSVGSSLIALKDEDRRARATLISTKEIYQDSPRAVFMKSPVIFGLRFRISIHGRTGKKSYISRDRSGIHMLKYLAEILVERTFQHRNCAILLYFP